VAYLAPQSTVTESSFEHRIPTPDGGLEVISAAFKHPSEWLSTFREGKIYLMPPQFYILATLCEVFERFTSQSVQREQIIELSRTNFGKMVIHPQDIPHPRTPRFRYLVYEGDEDRGGAPGRRHRAEVDFGKGKVISSIRLERNFDIFTECPQCPLSVKL